MNLNSPFHQIPVSRRSLLGGALGASALALAGCSGSSNKPAAEAPAPSSTAVIGRTDLEILAWTNGPTIDANFKKRVEQFNSEFSGKFTAKINFLPYDQYWQKIQLQYAANKPFDIYYWDVQAYAHYKKSLILNQQPAVDATDMVNPDKYPVALYDPWKFDGSNLYCVPENIQSMAMFYNKSHFDEAGIGYPDATWTWDKVMEVAPQLTKQSGGKTTQWGLDIGDLGVWWGIQTLAWAAGSAFVDKPLEPTAFQMTDPKVVEAMKFVQDLMWDKHIAPRPDERDAVSANNGGFASGTYSMAPGGTWNIASYTQMKDKWAMAPLPLYQGQKHPAVLAGRMGRTGEVRRHHGGADLRHLEWHEVPTHHGHESRLDSAGECRPGVQGDARRDAGRLLRCHEEPSRRSDRRHLHRPTCNRSSTRCSDPTSTSSSATS